MSTNGEETAHPDPNDLVGFAEGRLPSQEHRVVQAHLLACDSCRDTVVTLVGEPAPGARRRVSRKWLTAAAILVGAALVFWIMGPTRDGQAREEMVVIAAAELARDRPNLFDGFESLTPEELRSARSKLERGGVRIHYPVGLIVKTRPSLAWSGEPGIERWRIRLLREDGTVVWEAESSSPRLEYPAKWPALEAGSGYLIAVKGEGPLGEAAGNGQLRVASAAQRRDLEAALQAIESSAATDVAPILQAHFAIRREAWALAEERIRDRLARHPDDVLAQRTLLHVLIVTGSPQARQLETALRSGRGD